jgi:hypothetical protein
LTTRRPLLNPVGISAGGDFRRRVVIVPPPQNETQRQHARLYAAI